MANFFNNLYEGPAYDLTTSPESAWRPPEKPSWRGDVEAAGKAVLKTGVNVASMGTIIAGGVVGLMEGGIFEHRASDNVFRIYDEYLRPARKYLTPDPESTSFAGKIASGITGLAPYLATGPAAIPLIIGTATFDMALDMLDSGVSPKAAVGMGVLSGTAAGLMTALPMGGKTSLKTLALATLNPALGAATEEAQKLALEAGGYHAQAQGFNPLDPVNRSLDFIMGVMFGGIHHYAKARETMPIEHVDAIDTAANAQKVAKSNPFETKDLVTHDTMLNKAASDISEGRPVDVADIGKNASLKAEQPVDPEVKGVMDVADAEFKANMEAVKAELDALGFPYEEPGAGPMEDTPPPSLLPPRQVRTPQTRRPSSTLA